MNQDFVLHEDVRVFKRYDPNGARLYRAEALIKKGKKIKLGKPFKAYYDHREQLAARVENFDDSGDPVFVLLGEIQPMP